MRRWTRIAGKVALLLAPLGCDSQSPPPPAPPVPPPTAAQTFAAIIEQLENDLEPSKETGVVVFGGSGSRSTVRYSVDGRFVPPSGTSTGPKGIVHISVNSLYVAAAPTPEEEAEPAPSTEPLQGDPGLVEGIDPELLGGIPVSPGPPKGLVDTAQRRHSINEAKDYELSFHDGQWQLDTQLEPDFESALQIAFERALSRQEPATE